MHKSFSIHGGIPHLTPSANLLPVLHEDPEPSNQLETPTAASVTEDPGPALEPSLEEEEEADTASYRSNSPFYPLPCAPFIPPASPALTSGAASDENQKLQTPEALTPKRSVPKITIDEAAFESVKSVWDSDPQQRQAAEGTSDSKSPFSVEHSPSRSSSATVTPAAVLGSVQPTMAPRPTKKPVSRQLFPSIEHTLEIDAAGASADRRYGEGENLAVPNKAAPLDSSESSYDSDQSTGGVSVNIQSINAKLQHLESVLMKKTQSTGSHALEQAFTFPTHSADTDAAEFEPNVENMHDHDEAAKALAGLSLRDVKGKEAVHTNRATDSAVPATTLDFSSLTPNQKSVRAKAMSAYILAGGYDQTPGSFMMPIPMSPTMAEGTPAEMNPPTDPLGAPEQHQSQFMENMTGMLGKPVRVHDGPGDVSRRWQELDHPFWSEIAKNIPFANPFAEKPITNHSVIVLTQIPYNITKRDVQNALGDEAAIVQTPMGSKSCGIHVIMERSTGRSMDCYVEIESEQEADKLLARLAASPEHCKIGNRHFDFAKSSQETLMKELFPRAKCVTWNGPTPIVQPPVSINSAQFNGFVTHEELTMAVKIANNPQRTRFAGKHPERPFESIISLVIKFPWHSIQYYRLKDRDMLHESLLQLIDILMTKLRSRDCPANLDKKLLDDLMQAGLTCPGFSEMQRTKVVEAVAYHLTPRVFVFQTGHMWPFEVINRNEDASLACLSYVIKLIRLATTPTITEATTIQEVDAIIEATGGYVHKHWGAFRVVYPDDKSEMTIFDVVNLEWSAITAALEKVVYQDET